MHRTLTIGTLLCLASLVHAQCNTLTNSNCSACTSSPGCGWCTPVQQCMDGSPNGPTAGKCLGPSWQFGQGKCARCESFTDCRQCLVNAADCGWCAAAAECRPLSTFSAEGSCPLALNCPCNVYRSCDQCTQGSNCAWCLGDSTCKVLGEPCVGPSFNKSQVCPCDVHKTCPSCFDADNCQWCQNTKSCMNYGTNGTNCQIALGSCNAYCSIQGNGSCSQCNAINGCGWCPKTQQCVDASSGTCLLLMHNCENCERNKYCEPCGDDPNCQWCETTGTCQSKQYPPAPCQKVSQSCSSYCNDAQTCSSCNTRKGCGWCNADSTCQDVVDASCDGMWVHSCEITPLTPSKCSFNSGDFVGGMFLVIGLIVLIAIAYIVFRWKTGNKILYTELK